MLTLEHNPCVRSGPTAHKNMSCYWAPKWHKHLSNLTYMTWQIIRLCQYLSLNISYWYKQKSYFSLVRLFKFQMSTFKPCSFYLFLMQCEPLWTVTKLCFPDRRWLKLFMLASRMPVIYESLEKLMPCAQRQFQVCLLPKWLSTRLVISTLMCKHAH